MVALEIWRLIQHTRVAAKKQTFYKCLTIFKELKKKKTFRLLGTLITRFLWAKASYTVMGVAQFESYES